MTIEQIVEFLRQEIASAIHEDIINIHENTNFLKIGVSSLQALSMINKIKKKLEIDINPVAILEHKTISEFANYINECLNNKITVDVL